MTSSQPRQVDVLLVEDSPDDAFFFHRAIGKCGVPAATQVAVDGLKAMDYLLKKGRFADAAKFVTPDIIFLDLKLPHVNGFEFLEWMRTHAECPRIPVVVLTSSNHPADQQRAEALGAACFLTKPPTPEQIRELLEKYSGAGA
jgi:CheY-like chemotaxis protein